MVDFFLPDLQSQHQIGLICSCFKDLCILTEEIDDLELAGVVHVMRLWLARHGLIEGIVGKWKLSRGLADKEMQTSKKLQTSQTVSRSPHISIVLALNLSANAHCSF